MSLSVLRTELLNKIAKGKIKVSLSTVTTIANKEVGSKEEYCKGVAEALSNDNHEALAAEFLRLLEPKEKVEETNKESDSKES